jgi:hypothetical protein
MSSILDALERASQDRLPGKTDILPDAAPLPDEHKSRLRHVVVLAIVLFSVIALFWFLFARDATEPDLPVQTQQRSQPQATAPASTQESSVEARVDNSPVVQRELLTAERIRSTSQPNQRPLVAEAVLSQKRRQQAKADAPKQASPVASVIAKSASVEEQSPAVLSAPKRDDEPSFKVESSANQVAAVEQSEQQQIPLIWELDQALREELEQLKTTIHVYHENAAQRFVIINRQRYSEGDTLGVKNYRLHAIDREGIVVDYGGGLVRLLRDTY